MSHLLFNRTVTVILSDNRIEEVAKVPSLVVEPDVFIVFS